MEDIIDRETFLWKENNKSKQKRILAPQHLWTVSDIKDISLCLDDGDHL